MSKSIPLPFFIGLTVMLLLFACAKDPKETQSTKTAEPAKVKDLKDEPAYNTFTVLKFLGSVMKQDTVALREIVNPDYIQHNPFIPTGLESFIDLLPVLKKYDTKVETVRMFQDGNYVVMHNIWRNAEPFGAKEMVSFDILRIDENGKIAEHWDALTPLVNESASGRSQTDGETHILIRDTAKTEENKLLAKRLIEDILMGKNPDKIADYISTEQYHQHNPGIKDGLEGIMEAVQELTAANKMFQYTKIHKVLGKGNFVLTISEGRWSGKPQVFYDLFRFQDGKAVEHWDVIQEIPSEGLANDNGMFDFK